MRAGDGGDNDDRFNPVKFLPMCRGYELAAGLPHNRQKNRSPINGERCRVAGGAFGFKSFGKRFLYVPPFPSGFHADADYRQCEDLMAC